MFSKFVKKLSKTLKKCFSFKSLIVLFKVDYLHSQDKIYNKLPVDMQSYPGGRYRGGDIS